jgi:hypothetical protein
LKDCKAFYCHRPSAPRNEKVADKPAGRRAPDGPKIRLTGADRDA